MFSPMMNMLRELFSLRAKAYRRSNMVSPISSKWEDLHFVLIPLMCPGHLIPIVDIARLIAQHHVNVTIVTTPVNAARVGETVSRASAHGLSIKLLVVKFPAVEAGLQEGCESVDDLPCMGLARNLIAAAEMMRIPIKRLLREASGPAPSCIISDRNLAWTSDIARDLGIPRVLFDGMGCFTHLCMRNLHLYKPYEKVVDRHEPFEVPDMLDTNKVMFTRAQLPGDFNPYSSVDFSDIRERIRESAKRAYAVIINSFEELEPAYIEAYKKTDEGVRAWCVGPASLCNMSNKLDMIQRGQANNLSIYDHTHVLEWLETHKSGSVIYACLGSLNRVTPAQMKEMGRGLESSQSPFIWVIRGANRGEEIEKWLSEDGFEERVEGRGLLIRGWAPQVLILSHPSIGGFLTHCGWNSTLEGISAGLPMVTWPLFAEQFFNEKVVVDVLRVGVGVGAKEVVHIGEEDNHGVMVNGEDIKVAVDKVMSGDDEEAKERRIRVKELANKAKEAIGEGGSSYINIKKMIENIKEYTSAIN